MGIRLQHNYLIALKRMAAVEAVPEGGRDRAASHQHELNGVSALREMLGSERIDSAPATWLALNDYDESRLHDIRYTWYESRKPPRSEWRLYHSGTPETAEGDLLVILKREDLQPLLFVSCPRSSTWEHQLFAMFGVQVENGEGFEALNVEELAPGFRSVFVDMLQAAGWEPDDSPSISVDVEHSLSKFPTGMPATKELSAVARAAVTSLGSSADDVLEAWWDAEETIFRALEHRELDLRLAAPHPFKDVDDFMAFSLGAHQRRKSRAGHALENHIEALLEIRKIRFTRGARTEGKRRPDFILPGIEEYRDPTYPAERLLMLASKTTCKDRWRQVLNEAARIGQKHLLTLEPAISSDQLREMESEHLQLVVPASLHRTYALPRGYELWTVERFLAHASDLQTRR